MQKGDKVYITKYALTEAIIEATFAHFSSSGEYINTREFPLLLLSKCEVHSTKEQAEAKFEEMRIKKLQSLDKQLKKISAMKPKFAKA